MCIAVVLATLRSSLGFPGLPRRTDSQVYHNGPVVMILEPLPPLLWLGIERSHSTSDRGLWNIAESSISKAVISMQFNNFFSSL